MKRRNFFPVLFAPFFERWMRPPATGEKIGLREIWYGNRCYTFLDEGLLYKQLYERCPYAFLDLDSFSVSLRVQKVKR